MENKGIEMEIVQKKRQKRKSGRKRGFENCHKLVLDEKDDNNAVQQWRETTKRIITVTGQKK